MKSTVETLEDNRVKLSVEVDEAEFDTAVDAAFKRIAKEVRMPGFRPGKAPRRLLEAPPKCSRTLGTRERGERGRGLRRRAGGGQAHQHTPRYRRRRLRE